MKIKAKLSPLLVISNSTLYNDIGRMFMEYIDNSIDSAERLGDLHGNLSNDFLNPLLITIKIEGKYYTKGKIKITDDSTGIKDLRSVVENIGKSEKRNNMSLNGQFGYGIYSFMAFCDTLEITSKHASNPMAEYVKIERKNFDVEDIDQVEFDVLPTTSTFGSTGTSIVLSGFHSSHWLKIDSQKFKKEIEEHFELILMRKNIEISISNNSNKYICKPFDYTQYEGYDYKKEIEVSYWNPSIKQRVYYNDKLKIYLRMTTKNALNRPPVMISKGRRIIELFRLKSFRSNHHSNLWNHPNITGYIDTGSILNPTLARNDFQDTEALKRVFKAIRKCEDEILDWVKSCIKTNSKNDYSEIENSFNDILSDLEKYDLDAKNKFEPNKIVRLRNSGDELEEILVPDRDGPIQAHFKVNNSGRKTFIPPGSISQFEKQPIKSHPFSKDRSYIQYTKNDSLKLKIRIDDDAEPLIDSEGRQKRSELYENTVVIYRKHKDFEDRIDKSSRMGEEKISHALITYISSELLVHYTQLFLRKNCDIDKSMNNDILLFFTDKLYKLEQSLKVQVGNRLNK